MIPDLNTIWFFLVGILLTGYAILDGFDLGVGGLHLLARGDQERRIFLNAIGPVWDGNEVWLVTGGGALFAAFPNVYATVFSGFYDAFMLLLAALIFRAVAIEFRSQRPGQRWRTTWDVAFSISSLVSALLIGVALGNIVWGVPLNQFHEFQGDFFTLLNPYSLFVGLVAVVLLVMHGNLYLILKTEGPLQAKLRQWARYTIPAYLVGFVLLHVITVSTCPQIRAALPQRWWILGLLLVLSLLFSANIWRETQRGRAGWAFMSSCLAILTLMLLVGGAMYPTLVFSLPATAHSLNIYNGASTDKTLMFMFIVALIGVPLVLTYTTCIYYAFRGKVRLTEESY
jgi:cytochrome bd ubiquinol oxidase subunit II